MKINFKHILFISLLFSSQLLIGQLSSGGYPIEIQNLKTQNLKNKIKILPKFDLKDELLKNQNVEKTKSIKYAHSFEVAYTPENDGEWFQSGVTRIWQLHIVSENALSLSVIFSKYLLPANARLFIFDPNRNVVLGAFTNKNNKPYKKLACYPIPGSELIIQYEEPINAEFRAELEIGKINHDFLGVVNLKNRWHKRPSGECNIDVNCNTAKGLDILKRSVCRIFCDDELGTGTLLNNTAEDGKPLIISAFHIFDDTKNAEITLFDFNYESPFCTSIDGYDNQTISGSTALAAFDSLDFILLELSEIPPADFRPFYAGWDAGNHPPSNAYTIHHPNGDVKKISHDTGTCDSMWYNKSFIKNAQWKVLNWETGTTEAGSSGAAILDKNLHVRGTLSGGNASCAKREFDSFSRFDKMWNYSSDSTKQLRCWLDSLNLKKDKIDGFDPYEPQSMTCTVISNFMFEDELTLVNSKLGIYSNNEVAERFSQIESGSVSGVSVGIDDFEINSENAEIIIRLYTGNSQPEFAEKQYRFPMKRLTVKAMNYFDFKESIYVEGNFFISVELANKKDKLSLYQSHGRTLIDRNTMLVNQGDNWNSIDSYTSDFLGASLLLEVTVCSLSIAADTSQNDKNSIVRVYPNPANYYLTVEFSERRPQNEVKIFDRVGNLLFHDCFEDRLYADINVSNFSSGIYFISYESEGQSDVKRIVIY